MEVGFWVFLVSLKGGSRLDQTYTTKLSLFSFALLLIQCRGGSVSVCRRTLVKYFTSHDWKLDRRVGL